MFWRFGGYANISTIDSILDKSDVTLEEILDEADLIQELKQSNSKLLEYLRDENVLRRMLEYVVAPSAPKPEEDGEEDTEEQSINTRTLSPFKRSREQREKSRRQEAREEWDKADKARQKTAYVACEVLSSEAWSIIEALMENQQHLRSFWDFLRREPPLPPSEAGYFLKINEILLDKKTEETLRLIRSLDGIVPAMVQHVDCPMIMDLLLKIISKEKDEGGAGIVNVGSSHQTRVSRIDGGMLIRSQWFQSQGLIPLLLAYFDEKFPPSTQTSAGEFIKAIITISANASQNEQNCIGPNNLTRQLVSEQCIETLIQDMLHGGNPLTVIVGTIIEVIRKNNSDYDPDMGTGADSIPSSNDPIYLGTLLRNFAKHVPDFMNLILSPDHNILAGDNALSLKRKDLAVAFSSRIEPLGFDRFKTCELMAELLHCSNMGLLNERGSEAYIKQRNAERDRLQAEGSLMASRPQTSSMAGSVDEGPKAANGISPLGLAPGSMEEVRKLEVANLADEDGFEDVGNPADLADEVKDDFDEKLPLDFETKPEEIHAIRGPSRPRIDLDEEFVDEPLNSPRLEALDEREEELLEELGPSDAIEVEPDPEAEPAPLSPTHDLRSQVRGLALDKEIPPPNDDLSGRLEPEHQGPDQASTNPPISVSEAPPLPQRRQSAEIHPRSDFDGIQDFSPHPADKPPPLFADRPEVSASDGFHYHHQGDEHGRDSQETIDTTLGEEGDSVRSVLMSGNEFGFTSHIEADIDGQPMVGDYLKIMFVEHKVVPTILVRFVPHSDAGTW